MPSRNFSGSRLRHAAYDPATRQLDLHWQGGRVDAYRPVPDEVWRRLCSAPNPATYWEDRIAEEYPKVRALAPGPAPGGGGPTLHDLFGGLGDADPPADPELGGEKAGPGNGPGTGQR